jgi:hypothetical protein
VLLRTRLGVQILCLSPRRRATKSDNSTRDGQLSQMKGTSPLREQCNKTTKGDDFQEMAPLHLLVPARSKESRGARKGCPRLFRTQRVERGGEVMGVKHRHVEPSAVQVVEQLANFLPCCTFTICRESLSTCLPPFVKSKRICAHASTSLGREVKG